MKWDQVGQVGHGISTALNNNNKMVLFLNSLSAQADNDCHLNKFGKEISAEDKNASQNIQH